MDPVTRYDLLNLVYSALLVLLAHLLAPELSLLPLGAFALLLATFLYAKWLSGPTTGPRKDQWYVGRDTDQL